MAELARAQHGAAALLIQQAREKHDDKRDRRGGIRPGEYFVPQVAAEKPKETGPGLEAVGRAQEPDAVAPEISQIESFDVFELGHGRPSANR